MSVQKYELLSGSFWGSGRKKLLQVRQRDFTRTKFEIAGFESRNNGWPALQMVRHSFSRELTQEGGGRKLSKRVGGGAGKGSPPGGSFSRIRYNPPPHTNTHFADKKNQAGGMHDEKKIHVKQAKNRLYNRIFHRCFA